MTQEAEDLFVRTAAEHPRMFWLDGGGARPGAARRSLIGWLEDDDLSLSYDAARREVRAHWGGPGGPSEVVGDDPFAALEEAMAADAAAGVADEVSWVGYFGYAARPDLPARVTPTDGPRVPDALWMRARHVRELFHPETPAPPPTTPPPPPGPVPAGYATAYAEVQERLHAGDSYEVNLTYRVPGPTDPDEDPAAAYLRLRALNPAPYAGFLQHAVPGAGVHLLSSSPERFAVVDRHGWVETKPIKGTTLRGATAAEDAAQAERLATDEKFRAENLMIVDLLRNDVGLVSDPGTVEVPVLMEVESYASVHQLVSTVRGRLRAGTSTVAALRALFPAGSMTGAPKLRTMEIIANVEDTPRGVYAGAFGWIAGDGRADLGVVIRSWVRDADGRWELGTGGGITVGSDPETEHAESRWKADRLLRVFTDPSS
ncbi:MAG: anthranilate synthase component I family protein [Nocardioides sp.]|nr:anthranilate synthase component I family protein [Nocardioides sp.]